MRALQLRRNFGHVNFMISTKGQEETGATDLRLVLRGFGTSLQNEIVSERVSEFDPRTTV